MTEDSNQNLPGAFTTQPPHLDDRQKESVESVSIMPRMMKGGLANMVDGVYNIVNMVNPLGAKAETSQPPTPDSLLKEEDVAADVDEKRLADANADNPENARPPTPTRSTMFGRLRFPTPTQQQDTEENGPVSQNVAQRTGKPIVAGSEERRRYMRRMSKAPQLNQHREDDEETEEEEEEAEPEPVIAAGTIEGWRFISPRNKRVKRRVLWRLFLAQEIAPAVYDETASIRSPGEAGSLRKRMLDSQRARNLRVPSGVSASSADSVARSISSSADKQPAIWAMEFSACGRYLAAGGRDGVVRVWRLRMFAKEQTKAEATRPAGHARQQSTALFANSAPLTKHKRSCSSGTAATSPIGAEQASVDTESQEALHPMHAYELLEPVPYRSYMGHAADVLALAWSKNGFLLSASMDRTVRLWHPKRPECLCTFRHRDIVTSVAFNPRDDRFFASGSLDCRLRVWDIPARGVKHWTRLPEGQMVTAVAFCGPLAEYIVAGTYKGMCVFYSADELAVQGRLHARSSRGRNARGSKITGFAESLDPQGMQRLLVSSNDSRLRLFLPSERSLERKYKGHANASSQAYARFSSDGRYIVSGSEDHNVYVWGAAQDNAATVSTHPGMDQIRRHGHSATPSSAAQSKKSDEASSPQPLPRLAATLLGRRKSNQHPNSTSDEPGEGEWESLDGWAEEKAIYEYFPAHDAPVSQALFAPAATLQYLADHGDPILSRPKMRRMATNEVVNLSAPTGRATFPPPSSSAELLPNAVEDMTAIIVSADTRGTIRAFRKDINAAEGELPRPPPMMSASSRSSLVKAKDSIGSLGRAVAAAVVSTPPEQPPPDLSSYSLTQTALSKTPTSHDDNGTLGTGSTGRSFWGRLGRRMTLTKQKKQQQSPEKPAPPVQPCGFCGSTKFIDFDVAHHNNQLLSVCANCQRVKNLPK